ncbi:MAG: radical SAM protein [Spirochaetales bacterium]|nr:radical SAM protein [Spirochaetales bacterium]
MYFTNLPKILKLAADPAMLRFIFKLHQFYSEDRAYSPLRFLKSMINMSQSEKIQCFEGKYILTSFLPPMPSKAFFQLIQATNQKYNFYSQHMKADTSGPISFFLSLTKRCVLNCHHCSAKGRESGKELSTASWKKIIHEIQAMGTSIIGFTGGEPLLREDLEEIISSVSSKSTTYLFTCGKGLDKPRAASLKKAGLFAAGISLDSAIAEEHNKCRGVKGAFEAAIEAIKNSRAAGLYTMIQTVILKKDLSKQHFFSICCLARDLGVHEIRVLEPIKSGRFFMDSPNIFYTSQDRKKLIALHHQANRVRGFPKISTFANTESDNKYGCGAGIQHSYINHNGDLYPCDFVPMCFGNAEKNNLKELWDRMKKAFGKPHSGCFALTNYSKIAEKSLSSGFPLKQIEAEEICASCQAEDYPKYYRILQGRE